MTIINRSGLRSAGFLDDLSSISNHNNVDTSRSRSSQILREMKMARRDARILAQEIAGKQEVSGSPYVKDREQKYIVKGQAEETHWQVVQTRAQQLNTARDSEILEQRERDLQASREQLNLKKLNIL
jgi:hypothetical protein